MTGLFIHQEDELCTFCEQNSKIYKLWRKLSIQYEIHFHVGRSHLSIKIFIQRTLWYIVTHLLTKPIQFLLISKLKRMSIFTKSFFKNIISYSFEGLFLFLFYFWLKKTLEKFFFSFFSSSNCGRFELLTFQRMINFSKILLSMFDLSS